MRVRQFASRSAATGVAVIAAVASYSHMEGLAHEHGQSPLLSALMPLSVDGLMIVATVAISDGRTHRWSAWLSFWLGVGASVSANVLAARPDIVSRLISAWPSIALLAVVEMIARSGRDAKSAVDLGISAARNDVKTEPGEPVTRPTAKAARAKPAAPGKSTRTAAKVAKAAAVMPGASRTEIAARAGVSEPTARRYLPAGGASNGVNGASILDEVTA